MRTTKLIALSAAVVAVVAVVAGCIPLPGHFTAHTTVHELFTGNPESVPGVDNGLSYGTPTGSSGVVDPRAYPKGSTLELDVFAQVGFEEGDGPHGPTIPVCVQVMYLSASGPQVALEQCTDIPFWVLYEPGPLGFYAYEGRIHLGGVELPAAPAKVAVLTRIGTDIPWCRTAGPCGARSTVAASRVSWSPTAKVWRFPAILTLSSVSAPLLPAHRPFDDEVNNAFTPMPPRNGADYLIDAADYPDGASISVTADAQLSGPVDLPSVGVCLRIVAEPQSSPGTYVTSQSCPTLAQASGGPGSYSYSGSALPIAKLALQPGPTRYSVQLVPQDWSQAGSFLLQPTATTISW